MYLPHQRRATLPSPLISIFPRCLTRHHLGLLYNFELSIPSLPAPGTACRGWVLGPENASPSPRLPRYRFSPVELDAPAFW